MSLDVYLRAVAPCDECEQLCTKVVFRANITHNLGAMAEEAKLYRPLWRPGNSKKAGALIRPLREGLALLKSDPGRFKAFNPENGYGSYDGLCGFIEKYLAACENWPDADVEADV